MSFGFSTISGVLPPYTPDGQNTPETVAANIVGMWILDQLKTKYPYVMWDGGQLEIYYSWGFSLDPTRGLQLPAVAVEVNIEQYPRLGSLLDADGFLFAGDFRRARVYVSVMTADAFLRDALDNIMFNRIHKIVNLAKEELPFTHMDKIGFSDLKGFSMVDRFVQNPSWQNMLDQAFYKTSIYEMGFMEEFIDDDDNMWNGVIGSMSVDYIVDGKTVSVDGSLYNVVLGIKFQPNL